MKKIISELIKSKVFVGYGESKLHKTLPSYMGISLALIPLFLIIASLIPIFLYTSPERISNIVLTVNYKLPISIIFITSIIPVLIFSDVNFLSFYISVQTIEDIAKKLKASWIQMWLSLSIISFIYSIVLLLLVYSVSALTLLLSQSISIGFKEMFPFPFISVFLIPAEYLLVNMFVWGMVLILHEKSTLIYWTMLFVLFAITMLITIIFPSENCSSLLFVTRLVSGIVLILLGLNGAFTYILSGFELKAE